MVTYYGWVELRETTGDEFEPGYMFRTIDELKVEVARYEEPGYREITLRPVNGWWVLLVAGSRNRRHVGLDDTIELLRWVAKKLPGSFGLLYVLDDEDQRAEFRESLAVWKLARGVLEEKIDGVLSPIIPVIEDDVP